MNNDRIMAGAGTVQRSPRVDGGGGFRPGTMADETQSQSDIGR